LERLRGENTLGEAKPKLRRDDQMEFVILGSTALQFEGTPVPLGAAKQRGMLAVLLYHLGEPVRVETLVEYLWDGRTPEECREQLYTLASRARASLGRAGLGAALVRVPSVAGYRLDVDPLLVDFHRFRHMAASARDAAARDSYDTAAALLTAAIELWRDEPVADLKGRRAEHLRRSMKDSLVDAHRSLAACLLRLGRHEAVLALLEPLLPGNDLDEAIAQHWINALCAAGRESDARIFVSAFRRRFRKEMRTEPHVELPTDRIRLRGRNPAGEANVVGEPRVADVSGPVGPRQLPQDITDFTGQGDLLGELDVLTDPDGERAGIVVVTGMPGVGKTTTAVHWAHRQRHRFPDGQLYLNANAYGPMPGVDPDEALGRFLQALDVPPDRIPLGAEERRDRLNRLLAGRRVLILLDNIRDSRQARPLLTTAESCVTVITSRSRLKGLSIRDGVPNLTVSPLPEDESLALLSRVIGAARATAEPDALRALARLSDGLPLALRIIGEHLVERPRARIADLVDELSTRLLDGDAEDDEASLRTVFAWSYEALPPPAARLFRLLGLHPGATVSPEAAGALMGIGPRPAERTLNTLARFHLINHDTAGRYRFHDLLRRYAADRAGAEEPPDEVRRAIRRLLDWYVLTAANAAAILAPGIPAAPDLPAPEGIEPQAFADDEDAMRWCAAERGHLLAVTRWAVEHGLHRHAWQLPGVVHEVFERYGRQDDVLELLRLAESAARADRHQPGLIGVLNNLGATYFAVHDYRRAAERFTAALDLARAIGLVDAELVCLHNLATVHLKSGETATAVSIYERVLAARRASCDLPRVAADLHWLGDAYRRMSRYEAAEAYYREALDIRQRTGSPRAQGATHTELAALYLETRRLDLALEHSDLACELHARARDEAALCDALSTAADVRRELGLGQEAVRDARRASVLSEEIGDSPRRCHALAALAHALAATGHTVQALGTCDQALALLDLVTDPDTQSLRGRVLALRDSLDLPAAG
jgi:tetratricopeptide (TPR) repeat protein